MRLQTTVEGKWECIDCIDIKKLIQELREENNKLIMKNRKLEEKHNKLLSGMRDLVDYA